MAQFTQGRERQSLNGFIYCTFEYLLLLLLILCLLDKCYGRAMVMAPPFETVSYHFSAARRQEKTCLQWSAIRKYIETLRGGHGSFEHFCACYTMNHKSSLTITNKGKEEFEQKHNLFSFLDHSQ